MSWWFQPGRFRREPSIPNDEYNATLKKIQSVVWNGKEYPVWHFTIRVFGREETATAVLNQRVGAEANDRAWAEVVLGRPLADGEEPDPTCLRGKHCRVKVQTTFGHRGEEFPRVIEVLRPAGQAKPGV